MESKPFLSKEFAWANWSRHGFSESDLVQVLRYLRSQVRRGERKPASMLFRNLIEYPENFEQELSLSKEARLQKKPETPRQEILRAAGRPEQPKEKVQSVKSILEGQALTDFMRQCKMEAGLL